MIKCAWSATAADPGSPFNMIGNDGGAYPVQTLWTIRVWTGLDIARGDLMSHPKPDLRLRSEPRARHQGSRYCPLE